MFRGLLFSRTKYITFDKQNAFVGTGGFRRQCDDQLHKFLWCWVVKVMEHTGLTNTADFGEEW